MGEIPFEVELNVPDFVGKHFVVYFCHSCNKIFLVEDEYLNDAFCPICGSNEHTEMDIEWT